MPHPDDAPLDTLPLEVLRERLAEVDRDLLARVAERQRTVAAIGRAKRRDGRPLRDFAHEKVVLEGARRTAAALGLAHETAERLMRLLIERSLAAQEHEQVTAGATGGGRRALVVGGAGRMGRWFARFLAAQDYDVATADPAGPVGGYPHVADWEREAARYELVVVAAPLAVSGGVLERLAALRPAGLVFDVASLKHPLADGHRALRAAGVRATSVHPMFGPGADTLAGRHVVFCDLGHAAGAGATEAAEALFADTLAVPVRMSLEAHDRAMAFVLGLSHAVNLAFGEALAGSGAAAPELARVSSTTFEAQTAVTRAVASEHPALYFEIQALNPHNDEALRLLEAAVAALRRRTASGDRDGFAAAMSAARRYLTDRPPSDAPGAEEPGVPVR